MDQCTHEVRAEYWKGIIKACGQRPRSVPLKLEWRKRHNVNRVTIIAAIKFRKQLIMIKKPLLSGSTGNAILQFVEISLISGAAEDTVETFPALL